MCLYISTIFSSVTITWVSLLSSSSNFLLAYLYNLPLPIERERAKLLIRVITAASISQWARKFKKVPAKENQFHEKKLLAKFYFLQFQNWPKINFWTREKFKTANNAISRKKINFTIFFAWYFSHFLAHCMWSLKKLLLTYHFFDSFSIDVSELVVHAHFIFPGFKSVWINFQFNFFVIFVSVYVPFDICI